MSARNTYCTNTQQIGCSELLIGAQDCHQNLQGPNTGDISAAMFADVAAAHVLLAHSERRADNEETDDLVVAKIPIAFDRGLGVTVCVGVTGGTSRRGRYTRCIVDSQLSGALPGKCFAAHTVVAYEPVWSIGTGRTPTAEQIVEVHLHTKKLTELFGVEGTKIRLLYGGSVILNNAPMSI